MAHNLSFDFEEERRGITARLKAAMESIIHKYQDVGEEEGDFITLDNFDICEDKGQLRHQEVAHFGFLQAALPEDTATPCTGNDDREFDKDLELYEDEDEQPSLGIKMLRDFGSRLDQSIHSKMDFQEDEDGKVFWLPQDGVEEDMLTSVGDSDSDRGDISGEDEWAESEEENDAGRRSPVEQNEESPTCNNSRGSAGMVDSEEELSDSSGISYREPQKFHTSTNSINQNHRRDDDYKEKTMPVHNGRVSMDMPTNRYKDNGSSRKGVYKHNKPTNMSTNGSNQNHKRNDGYKKKTMPVHKSRESMDMSTDRNKGNESYRTNYRSIDKHNKVTNISTNGSSSSAGVAESEDELADLSGISYNKAHKSSTSTGASSKDHKKDIGYKAKTLPVDRSKKSMETPTSKCKDNSSHRKTLDKHNKPKVDPYFSSLFPDDRRRKTPSKPVQRGDEHKGFDIDITPKREPPSTPVADCSKPNNSTPAKLHFHFFKKEELSNSTKKRQSHINVCMVEEFEYMYSESLPSSDSKHRKDRNHPKVESPCSSNSGRGTPLSGKPEKHRKKTDRKRCDQDVIDLLKEPDKQSEMGNVTPVHHRSLIKAEKPDQGASRIKCFSVPAKRRIMAFTSRDTDISSSSSAACEEADLSTHEAICDYLGVQPSNRVKQRPKYKHVPSTTSQSVEECGDSQKGKSDTGLGKQQDCKEHWSSSRDSGKRVISTASALYMVKKISVSKPPSTKERLFMEPSKHQGGSSQVGSLTDSSNLSFNSLSDEYPPDQREGSRNTEALQPSTSDSVDENCSSKSDYSIEIDHSDPLHTYTPQFSEKNSIKHVQEQLPPAKPEKALLVNIQNSKPLKSSQGSTFMTQHGPLTPILKTPGQRSATPQGEKKRVNFCADPTNVEEQCMQDALQSWKSRIQQSKINHDDSEFDLPSPESHQEDLQRQETSEEVFEEPAFSLPSSSAGDMPSHLKSPAIQTSTPRRDADKPRFSTPKGRKIPQGDGAPSPCTLVLDQLNNIKLGSPIQKGASPKLDVLNDQSSEKMELDESPKCSTEWTKQFASREPRKMDYGLTERTSTRESRILRVNNSNSSFSDMAAFSHSSASSGEKDDQTGSTILTPRRSRRLNSTNVVRAPKTDPRHNKRETENRPLDVTRRLNRSEVLNASEIDSDEGRTWSSKQPESPYSLRPRRIISSSEEQEVKDSPRKTSSKQNTKYSTVKGRKAEQLSRSVEKRKADDKFLLTVSQARTVDRQRKDTRQWGWRHSSFSSEAETTSSTQQVSSPEVGGRRVTRSQCPSEMDAVERKMTRGQMFPDTRGQKVTKCPGQSKTAWKSPGSAVNQNKGTGRRRMVSSSDEEVRGTPRKASSSQRMKHNKGKGRLMTKGD